MISALWEGSGDSMPVGIGAKWWAVAWIVLTDIQGRKGYRVEFIQRICCLLHQESLEFVILISEAIFYCENKDTRRVFQQGQWNMETWQCTHDIFSHDFDQRGMFCALAPLLFSYFTYYLWGYTFTSSSPSTNTLKFTLRMAIHMCSPATGHHYSYHRALGFRETHRIRPMLYRVLTYFPNYSTAVLRVIQFSQGRIFFNDSISSKCVRDSGVSMWLWLYTLRCTNIHIYIHVHIYNFLLLPRFYEA